MPTVTPSALDVAAKHFQRIGYEVYAIRPRTRFGELDLVAYDGKTLVFVEMGNLSAAERSTLRRKAIAWLTDTANRPLDAELRFDSVNVIFAEDGTLLRLDHMEAAF